MRINGLTIFFAFMLILDIAFGVYDFHNHGWSRYMLAPVIIGGFIACFYYFSRQGNDLGPR